MSRMVDLDSPPDKQAAQGYLGIGVAALRRTDSGSTPQKNWARHFRTRDMTVRSANPTSIEAGRNGTQPVAIAKLDTLLVDRDKTLTQKVGEGLRHAILSGRLEPGQRLIERTLCEMTGVSRTAVREALRALETEGLVVNVPNKGPMVLSVDVDEAREIYAFRELLETKVVELFMKVATKDTFVLLGEALEKMEAACKAQDFDLMNSEKEQFYAIIIDNCGNRLIRRSLNQVHAQIAVLRNMTMAQDDRPPLAFAEVKEIYEAMTAGNSKAARRACQRHVENAGRVAIESLLEKQQR
jgi:GntR family transcriptional regulator, trigonelline degradation regulator